MSDGSLQPFQHPPGVPQPHLALGGVHVDVHFTGWAFKIDHRQRMTSLHQSRFVSSSDGLKKRPRSDGTVVDEHVDIVALSSRDVGRADPSGPSFASGRVLVLWRSIQSDQIGGLSSHDVVKPVEHVVGRWNVQKRSAFGSEMKRTRRMSQGVVHNNVNNASGFCLRSPLKSQSSGRVLEQVFN